MNLPEFIFAILLALGLVILAVYVIWRQRVTLRLLRGDAGLPAEDRRFLQRQVRRRVACSLLMILFAGFLAGWYFIESRLQFRPRPDEVEPGRTPPVVEFMTLYWSAALLILFAILVLAVFDFLATVRFGMAQRRLLEIERRTALEIEAARLRKQREGTNGQIHG